MTHRPCLHIPHDNQHRIGAGTLLAFLLISWTLGPPIAGAGPDTPLDFADYATIEGTSNGEPIYSLGNITYIYGVSPDLMPGAEIQADNNHPKTKIKPKKSWEIKSNLFGAYPPNPSVRTKENDSQPLLPIHLIDGDPDTAWCSYGGFAPDVREEWIRIDLPRETTISSVGLVCSRRFALGNATGYVLGTTDYRAGKLTDWMGFHRWGGRALPRELKIQVSRDAWHWETVYETHDLEGNEQGTTDISFDARPAKQILITANNFKRLLDKYVGYAFSIGEVEVRDPQGANLALVSRGAGVTVSSTSFLMNHDRLTQQLCYLPVIYDLGLKWLNITADEGMQCWNNVERVKGRLEVDPEFDQFVTDLKRAGINILMSLDVKVNPIYVGRKQDWTRSRHAEINNSYYDLSGWAWEYPEAQDAYLRYVRFIVNHFKDRVSFWGVGSDWPGNPDVYKKLIRTVKEIDPDAGVMGGGEAGTAMLSKAKGEIEEDVYPSHLSTGALGLLASRVDSGFSLDHLKQFFPQARREIQEYRNNGYDGHINYSFMTWSIYPPGARQPGQKSWEAVKDEFGFTDFRYHGESEMVRAKLVAQSFVGCAGLNALALYCNPYFNSSAVGQSLFRVPEPGQVLHPMQPDAGYYTLRTICTVMDGWRGEEFPVEIKAERELERFTYRHDDGGRMIAAWIPGETTDDLVETRADVILPDVPNARKVWGIDLLNGTRQELNYTMERDSVILHNILIKDYPTLIQIEP